ncbi:hypothetical protein C8R46DRAFT_1135556 [Mycena filopes]|nr:hypothetical protein C8R46DRAFT_1135556 [Mycena filopes]
MPQPSPSLGFLLEQRLESLEFPELNHLLGRNDPPLESEIQAIHKAIASGQTRMDVLDAQIRLLQSTLAKLLQSRSETAQLVQKHRGVLSPVRRIPPELLGEIFGMASGDTSDADWREPPWYLGQVCCAWRRTALADTSLWNSITLSPSQSSESSINAQLIRSTGAPLDIYWPDRRHMKSHALLGIVLPHCERWRTLRMKMDYYDDTPAPLALLVPITGRLHSLQTLEMDWAPWKIIPQVFASAPKLRTILLGSVEYNQTRFTAVTHAPWGQITRYRGICRPNLHLDILAAAPRLRICSLGFMGTHTFDPLAHPGGVVLQDLRRLRTAQAFILPHIIAPALEALTCTAIAWPSDLPFLLSTADATARTLTTLVLLRCSMRAELLAVLRALPALTSLLLESDEPEEFDIFAPMTLSPGSSDDNVTLPPSESSSDDICPNLTEFTFGFYGDPPASFFAMVESQLIRVRLRGLSRLRVFYSRIVAIEPSEELVGWLGVLVEEERLDAAFLGAEDAERLTESLSV